MPPVLTPRRARVAACCVLLAVATGACDSGSDTAEPTTIPTTTTEPPTTEPATTVPRSTTTTTGVPRSTTTIVADISPGSARISGTVLGPQGPVGGALVRVERVVGNEVASVQLNTAQNGTFNLPSVRGGRYLLRAWKQPDLYQPQAEAFFLAADEQKSVELRMTQVGPFNVQTTVEPNPLPRDEVFTITVFLHAGSVNNEGFLQAHPRAGQEVQIALGPGLGLNGADRATTDSGGKASFGAKCRTPGPQSAELRVSADVRLPLALPECRAP